MPRSAVTCIGHVMVVLVQSRDSLYPGGHVRRSHGMMPSGLGLHLIDPVYSGLLAELQALYSVNTFIEKYTVMQVYRGSVSYAHLYIM